MKELISVIVPIFNTAPFLPRCIDSIINQSYSNLEILLVDDGSVDGSAEICDSYAALDSRIRVVHKLNGGISSARNTGMQMATGNLISFVDSDDYLDVQMLSVLYDRLICFDADVSICNFCYIHQDSQERVDFDYPLAEDVMSGEDLLLNCFFRDSMKQLFWSVLWNKLFKKELFYRLQFPLGYVLEDLFVLPRLFYKCKRVVCTKTILYYYVQHQNSVLHSSNRQILDGPVVYFALSGFFSGKKKYVDIYCQMLFSGLARYKLAFFSKKKQLRAEESFNERRYSAVSLFCSSWKNGKCLVKNRIKRYLFFEFVYVVFWFKKNIGFFNNSEGKACHKILR